MIARIPLTPDLMYAAGRDAADRHMRAQGRTYWTEADYNLACETVNRLAQSVAPERLREWGWA